MRLRDWLFGALPNEGYRIVVDPAAPAPSTAPVIPCPRCKRRGAEPRSTIVMPREDGAETQVGKGYGCPHCGLAWFTQNGDVLMFGHAKQATAAQGQGDWKPSPEMVAQMGERNAEEAKDKRRPESPDADMRWGRNR